MPKGPEHLLSRIEEVRKKLAEAEKKHVPAIDPSTTSRDKKAEDEARAIASEGGLKQAAAKKDHERSETLKDSVHTGILVLFWIAFGAILIAGSFWFYHLVLPKKCHFLEPDQVQNIGQYLFGGFLSTFVTKYASKIIK